jgi:hypothetical protein
MYLSLEAARLVGVKFYPKPNNDKYSGSVSAGDVYVKLEYRKNEDTMRLLAGMKMAYPNQKPL